MTFNQGTDEGALSCTLSLITIPQLAQELGFPLLKEGVQKSPFREDKNGMSFSIFSRGYAFKDHAKEEHQGNGFNFVQLARPQWTKKQCAEFIMKYAGVSDEGKQAENSWKQTGNGRETNGKGAGNRQETVGKRTGKVRETAENGQETNRKSAGNSRKQTRNGRKQIRKVDPWKEMKGKQPETELPACKEWSSIVRERFLEGWKHLKQSETTKQKLANERGWPVSVIDSLLEKGLISFPLLPWEGNGKRGIAFRVDMPQFGNNRKGPASMIPIGYHQRFFMNGRKVWIYVPYLPRKPVSHFQKQLETEGNKVVPFPFLLGNPETAKEIVILEGQWDAVTFSHACGFLETPLETVSVFGLRGNQSISPLLKVYRPLLEKTERIMVLADNDTAGKMWIEGNNSLSKKLREISSADVSIHLLKNGNSGSKDFNDYYKQTQR